MQRYAAKTKVPVDPRKPKAKTFAVELYCGCGAAFFVECPQESGGYSLCMELLSLSKAWNQAHAAHHKEPTK